MIAHHASAASGPDEAAPPAPVAIVTGGGSGIGLAAARRLSQRHRVICCGLERADEFPSGLEFRHLDVTEGGAVAGCFGDLERCDVLVNCAGIIIPDGGEFEIANFRKVIDVNLNAVHLVTHCLINALAAAGGCVVNVASMYSIFGSARTPGYAASKGGVVSLTRSHAVAFAERGVRVNAVAPGWIDTKLAAGAVRDPERSRKIMDRLPMKRFGEPADVGAAIAFLASDDARYITGAVLPVDGGYSIM
jgi:NAD(P)-dependent dehydrogenase (short-subunit alcohol dehydrogenase family)